MKAIITQPAFVLSGRVIPNTTPDGRQTIELFQLYPRAKAPRLQRVLTLTLTKAERAALVSFLATEEASHDPG